MLTIKVYCTAKIKHHTSEQLHNITDEIQNQLKYMKVSCKLHSRKWHSVKLLLLVYSVSQNKKLHFYIWNNSVKNEPILIIFTTLIPEGT